MDSKVADKLFTNWPLRRWIALGAGAFFLYQAFWYQDAVPGLLGAFFLFQAITNTGCLGSRSCAVPEAKSNRYPTNEINDVEFSEINDE